MTVLKFALVATGAFVVGLFVFGGVTLPSLPPTFDPVSGLVAALLVVGVDRVLHP